MLQTTKFEKPKNFIIRKSKAMNKKQTKLFNRKLKVNAAKNKQVFNEMEYEVWRKVSRAFISACCHTYSSHGGRPISYKGFNICLSVS